MISALQSATPVLDVAGAAGVVALTCQYTKFAFGHIREPLRTNVVRLYVFAVSLVYVYGWNWLYGTLQTGPQIVTAYSVALAVAGGALAGYHLLRGDFNGVNTPPATSTDTAPKEPVSTVPPIRVKRTPPDATMDRFGVPSEGEPAATEPESVPEWNLPPIVPPEPASPTTAMPVAKPSQEQETTVAPLAREDGS